ncbi:MAG: ABC transporter ATP-binding protein/permease [Bacilli bacterium]|jgi:ABC-type lipoprotein export system ATPase subunit/ABC-type antimicrobial peptide transport system permease subunit|nr:ABC transporter ATP-binding protein/permease [Bacilli bacterium]
MIKLNKVNKYYNKNKSNEIHVINNATLTLPEKGLVCFFGPSGCGKTTLLNAIGGLDSVNSGSIAFNDIVIDKYKAKKWDEIRSEKVGYIFQNYGLIDDISVAKNLELVLTMLGVDAVEAGTRIEYALKAVGMEKYKKRKAKQLSGGQQQRVAIARALVKSPDVVIADEPTGNLDEKNTTQIMNIIKKISEECLVVLVTHERRLADFYGDRIIEILDGKIVNDRDNKTGNLTELVANQDRNIYLKEYNREEIRNRDININYFFQEKKEQLKLNIIFRNNTFYITSNDKNISIKYVEENDEIKIQDTHKPVMTKEALARFDYNLPKLNLKKHKKRNVVKLKDTLKMAFAYINTLQAKQKLLLFTMFLSAVLVVLSFATFSKATEVVESDFLYSDRRLIEVVPEKKITIEDLVALQTALQIDRFYGNRYDQTIESFKFDLFEQTTEMNVYFRSFGVVSNKLLEEEDYLYRLDGEEGIVVDKWIIDKLAENDIFGYNMLLQAGGAVNKQEDYKKFLGLNCTKSGVNVGKIVGICDTNNPNIYVDDDLINLLTIQSLKVYDKLYSSGGKIDFYTDGLYIVNYLDNLNISEYKTLDGVTKSTIDLDLKDKEILLQEDYYEAIKVGLAGDKENIKFSEYDQVEYTIVGTYALEKGALVVVENINSMILDIYSSTGEIRFLTENKEEAKQYLQEKSYRFVDNYQNDYENYMASKTQTTTTLLVFSLIMLATSLIFLYFLMRSRLITRIYEIGVYRALGIKKADVYKTFVSEVLLLTLFSSMIGYVLGSIVMINLSTKLIFSSFISYNWFLAIIALVFIWVVNFIVGLLPIGKLLRKTPAEILSKYDI